MLHIHIVNTETPAPKYKDWVTLSAEGGYMLFSRLKLWQHKALTHTHTYPHTHSHTHDRLLFLTSKYEALPGLSTIANMALLVSDSSAFDIYISSDFLLFCASSFMPPFVSVPVAMLAMCSCRTTWLPDICFSFFGTCMLRSLGCRVNHHRQHVCSLWHFLILLLYPASMHVEDSVEQVKHSSTFPYVLIDYY